MAENVARALRGSSQDPEEFVLVYRHQFEPVLAYFVRRTYDGELALDLTSEVFAQAFLSRGRFGGETREEAEAWIFAIARRQLGHYFKRGKAQDRARRRLEIEAPAVDAERRAAIEELGDIEGVRSVLRSELSRLSDPQRKAVGLRVLGDMTYAEISERLGITEEAARTRVSRALALLASALEKNSTIKEAR